MCASVKVANISKSSTDSGTTSALSKNEFKRGNFLMGPPCKLDFSPEKPLFLLVSSLEFQSSGVFIPSAKHTAWHRVGAGLVNRARPLLSSKAFSSPPHLSSPGIRHHSCYSCYIGIPPRSTSAQASSFQAPPPRPLTFQSACRYRGSATQASSPRPSPHT